MTIKFNNIELSDWQDFTIVNTNFNHLSYRQILDNSNVGVISIYLINADGSSIANNYDSNNNYDNCIWDVEFSGYSFENSLFNLNNEFKLQHNICYSRIQINEFKECVDVFIKRMDNLGCFR